MRNQFFFQINVSEEQVNLANELVDYSIKNHPVEDIFAKDPNGKERQKEFRFTGTLGEIVFADAYGLPRPTRSFGAIGGQDFGQDFSLSVNGNDNSFDIKSMFRKNDSFRTNYVLNIPAYQMRRENVITDYYFCISIHKQENSYIASFLGYVSKDEIEKGVVGILYKAGTQRVKDDGGTFTFQRDTYEIDFDDITTPIVTPLIQKMAGYVQKTLLPPYKS
ncbi:MAG: hypothetical protein EAZ55_14585 [Cytophagales bacterium]|nr:MAG: hypothetical protein EAZ55_14585 [Cytophagales bacterium]